MDHRRLRVLPPPLARVPGNSEDLRAFSRQFWYLWSGSFHQRLHDDRTDPGMNRGINLAVAGLALR